MNTPSMEYTKYNVRCVALSVVGLRYRSTHLGGSVPNALN